MSFPIRSDSKDLMGQIPRHSRLASQGMELCLAAALFVSAAPASAAQAGRQPSWVPIGPEGGAITHLAAAPGGIVYAGALFGGVVLRSDDGGRHWRPPGSGLPASLLLTALAVVPGRPEIVYAAVDQSASPRSESVDAGGDQRGTYFSTDGGRSWLPDVGGPRSVVAMAATVEGSAVYALTSYGDGCVYRTTPGSRSWSRVALPDVGVSITADPHRPSTLYLGAASGLYRTRDGGETWSLLGGGSLPTHNLIMMVAVDPMEAGSLYALSRTFGSSGRLSYFLFHSPEDGLSWVSHPVPLLAGGFASSFAVEPGGKVLIAPYSPATGLLKTDDGGATWAAAPGEPRDAIWALLAAPGETANVYAGGSRGFWLSADAGDRWRASSAGLYAQVLTSVRIGSNGSSSFLYASAADPFTGNPFLFRRESGGAWKAVRGGATYAVIGVDPRRPEIVYGSLVDNSGNSVGLWKSYDGGLTWFALGFPEGELIDVFKIDPRSPDTLYAYAGSQTGPPTCPLSKSTDGGKTWACLLTTPYTGFSFFDTSDLLIDPADTSKLYLVSSSGQLYISRNGGAAWKPSALGLIPGQEVTILALDPSDSRRLYAAVGCPDEVDVVPCAASVLVSNDSAGSWTLRADGLTGAITSLAVDPREPRTLYSGVSLTGIFRSTDGGLHWHPFDAGLTPGSFIGGFLFDPVQTSIIYTVTDAEGVYMIDTRQP